ncbi:MAG: hypothetical protein LBP28_01470 [Coriobacteriales bacterium]|jgi:hypothetical protein|nr:hypothetical protein [Coriobacteriales bacterium]
MTPALTIFDIGLLAVFAVVVAIFLLYDVISSYRSSRRLRRELNERFGKISRQPLNQDSVPQYWQLRQRHEQLTDCIDERTWDDLSMDEIFVRLNTCLTSVGEEYLYALLHEPRFDQQRIAGREPLIDFLRQNPAVRLELQFLLTRMGRSDYSGLHLFNYEAAPQLPVPHGLLNVLTVLPWAFVALVFVWPTPGIIGAVLALVLNGVIHYRASRRLELYLHAVSYLSSMLWSTERILKLLQGKDIPASVRTGPLVQTLSATSALFKSIRGLLSGTARRTRTYAEADYMIEFLRIIFLTQTRSYNRSVRFLAENTGAFRSLYTSFGELEVALCVLSLRVNLPHYTRPVFIQDTAIKATGLFHPLLTEPVANDVEIRRNALITGSNASGKSTFIKAVAVNALLAQTINTCAATSFQLRPALVVSSMAARDNILAGESYFIAEIRSLKRLLDQAQRRYCLCFIDEILKGTNAVERVAASVAVLRHLASLDSLCLAATHDLELTVLLGEQYENYHFQEQVSDAGVSFDYRIHNGPSRSRNAIRLLSALGFDEAIVRDAEDLAYERSGRWVGEG